MRKLFAIVGILLFCSAPILSQKNQAEYQKRIDAKRSISEKKKEATNIAREIPSLGKRQIYIKQVITFAKQLNHPDSLAHTFNDIGWIERTYDEHEAAIGYFEDALEIWEKKEDNFQIGRSNFLIGGVLKKIDDYETALPYFLKSSKLFGETNRDDLKARANSVIGEIYSQLAQYQEASDFLNKCLTYRKEVNDTLGIANALLNLGDLYIKTERYSDGLEVLNQSTVFFIQTNNFDGAANAQNNIGIIYYEQDKNNEALEYYLKALGYENLEEETKATIISNMNLITVEKERYEDALKIYLELLKDDKISKSQDLLANINFNIANIYYRSENYEKADKYYKRAEEISIQTDNIELKLNTMRRMVDNYYFLKQPDSAVAYLDRLVMAEDKRKESYTNFTNFEIDKSTTKMLIAEQKQQQSLVTMLMILIGAILSVSLFGFYAYQQNNKRKLAEREKEQAEKEKQQKIEAVLKESELKTVRARLEGVDLERVRIANDLHNRVGMMMTSTKLHFEALGKKLDNIESSNKERFNDAYSLLKQTQQETRKVIHDIASQTLVEKGLIAQVEELIDKIKDADTININLTTEGINSKTKWDKSLEMKVYIILQELINNAIKYANADNLDILIEQEENGLSLKVEDDGQGFDLSIVNDGMGIRTTKDRVKDLGGNLNIKSLIGSGTLVSIEHINLN